MKTKIGMSIGLALTLMVGVFATMLALGLFTTTEVEAQQSPGSVTRSFNPATVIPGGTVTVTMTLAGDRAAWRPSRRRCQRRVHLRLLRAAAWTYFQVRELGGQRVRFTLELSVIPSFTYIVTAPIRYGGHLPISPAPMLDSRHVYRQPVSALPA